MLTPERRALEEVGPLDDVADRRELDGEDHGYVETPPVAPGLRPGKASESGDVAGLPERRPRWVASEGDAAGAPSSTQAASCTSQSDAEDERRAGRGTHRARHAMRTVGDMRARPADEARRRRRSWRATRARPRRRRQGAVDAPADGSRRARRRGATPDQRRSMSLATSASGAAEAARDRPAVAVGGASSDRALARGRRWASCVGGHLGVRSVATIFQTS